MKNILKAAVLAGAVSVTPGCGDDNCRGEVRVSGQHLQTQSEALNYCNKEGNENDLLTCADMDYDCQPILMRCSEVASRIHQVAEDGLVECVVQRDDN